VFIRKIGFWVGPEFYSNHDFASGKANENSKCMTRQRMSLVPTKMLDFEIAMLSLVNELVFIGTT